MRGRYTALGEVAQTGMKAIVDVRYERDRSIGGCVMFEQWEADVSTGIITRTMPAAVIGIAKSPLPCAVDSRRIYRGGSTRPLYISAAGCSLDRAAAAVERMHGPHRKPALVQLADAYTRAVAQP